MKRNPFKPYIIRYHNHEVTPKLLNSVWGNSLKWEGPARSDEEAIRKAKKANLGSLFRLYSINGVRPVYSVSNLT